MPGLGLKYRRLKCEVIFARALRRQPKACIRESKKETCWEMGDLEGFDHQSFSNPVCLTGFITRVPLSVYCSLPLYRTNPCAHRSPATAAKLSIPFKKSGVKVAADLISIGIRILACLITRSTSLPCVYQGLPENNTICQGRSSAPTGFARTGEARIQ